MVRAMPATQAALFADAMKDYATEDHEKRIVGMADSMLTRMNEHAHLGPLTTQDPNELLAGLTRQLPQIVDAINNAEPNSSAFADLCVYAMEIQERLSQMAEIGTDDATE